MTNTGPAVSLIQETTLFLAVLIVPLAAAYAAISLGSVALVYRWFLLIHIGALMGFILSHGVPALVAVRLSSSTPEIAKTYLLLARDRLIILSLGATLGLVLSTGVSLGFFGGYWGHGWIWAVLASAIVVTFSMSILGRRQFDRALKSLNDSGRTEPGKPMLTAAIGFAGLFLILWLVLFKPF